MNSPDPRPLSILQRWLQSVITHAAGVEAGVRGADAQALLAIQPEQIESVICRSQNQSSAERLQVYANAYYARLVECLQAEFPVLNQALGAELFTGFAVDYLQHFPSHSYTLGDLGAKFAEYLRASCPDEAAEGTSTTWPRFLIDLAELEWHFSQVYDGEGIEQVEVLTGDDLQGLSTEDWLNTRLHCAPCLRVVEFRYPIHLFWQASKNEESPSPPEPRRTWLAITRRNFRVRHLELTQGGFVLLQQLLAGETVGTAIATAAEYFSPDESVAANDLQAWFADWTAAGFFLEAQR